ncbi:hypothetical protein ANN_26189 [Periplaneta americana]|uniref:Uncharacterized protein n=1 Tax=Periplaneta americana TaxID=6978 RepID=A0ABQ8S5U2_PERAM|nr:hypothetical protein ANN_26189 [Periplaneta americana]
MADLCEGGNEPPKEKELVGSLTEKKLPSEGYTERNGEREKSSGRKKISNDSSHKTLARLLEMSLRSSAKIGASDYTYTFDQHYSRVFVLTQFSFEYAVHQACQKSDSECAVMCADRRSVRTSSFKGCSYQFLAGGIYRSSGSDSIALAISADISAARDRILRDNVNRNSGANLQKQRQTRSPRELQSNTGSARRAASLAQGRMWFSANGRPPGTTGSLDRPPWNVAKRRSMASQRAPEADLLGGGVSSRTDRGPWGKLPKQECATAREGSRPTTRLLASRPHAEAEVDDHPTRIKVSCGQHDDPSTIFPQEDSNQRAFRNASPRQDP